MLLSSSLDDTCQVQYASSHSSVHHGHIMGNPLQRRTTLEHCLGALTWMVPKEALERSNDDGQFGRVSLGPACGADQLSWRRGNSPRLGLLNVESVVALDNPAAP